MRRVISYAERGLVPDNLIRHGIRRLLHRRLARERGATREEEQQRIMRFVAELASSPIAVETAAANEQHYALPPAFFQQVLGPHMKYSCCYYPPGVKTLDAAEKASLSQVCQRAQIADGQRILELGCGWGSLTLWLASHYPGSEITAVSNSAFQREFITARAREKGYNNVKVITEDMRTFTTTSTFDRIVSIEMIEHMRNIPALFVRIAEWLTADGLFFVHIFTHHTYAYLYQTTDPHDWMGRYFFTGGMMPSASMLLYMQEELLCRHQWCVDGTHYARTARGWLDNMDAHKKNIMPVLCKTYGEDDATMWWHRWRIFFMACEELWGYRHGREWHVSHYLFQQR